MLLRDGFGVVCVVIRWLASGLSSRRRDYWLTLAIVKYATLIISCATLN